jgi:alpha(1,3/1,4) fucosyltransferase
MKVRLDFCDFWPGFVKTNNFFYNLLRERFDVELCDRPDFLIYADPGQHVHRVHDCVKIYFGIEFWPPDFRECDYALTCNYLDDARHLRLPYYILTGNPAALQKKEEEFAQIMAAKKDFCCFVVSNVGKKAQKRVEFFQRLCQYKKVDSAGRACNNIGRKLPDGFWAKQEFLRSYKFNIAFENTSRPGYTTEKLVEAMRARCLPIYWGNPRVAGEFNTKSFLYYSDFPSEDALIEKIIELDKDDAKYLEYLRQPYFNNDQPNEFFNRSRVLDFFEKVFTTPITPVSRRRAPLQVGRWLAVKKNRPSGQFPFPIPPPAGP